MAKTAHLYLLQNFPVYMGAKSEKNPEISLKNISSLDLKRNTYFQAFSIVLLLSGILKPGLH
jgi:hypothetical protein